MTSKTPAHARKKMEPKKPRSSKVSVKILIYLIYSSPVRLYLARGPGAIFSQSVALEAMYKTRIYGLLYIEEYEPSSPPGPDGLPLVGNILDSRNDDMWETARRWGEKYGPIVSISNLGSPIIFLNSYETMVDLLEKRGGTYSSRPKNVMLDLGGWTSWFIALFPYGDELRKSRQLLHRHFQINAVPRYYQIQEVSTHKLLDNLLSSPEDFFKHIRTATGRTILKITYGYDIKDKDDYYVNIAEEGMKNVTTAEGFFLVNLIPWLQYLPTWHPGTGFKKLSQRGREIGMEMRNKPYDMVKQSISNGIPMSSVTSRLIESEINEDGSIGNEELIKNVSGVAYGAGADTIVSSTITFVLAMVLHPEVMKRGQKELDQVLGKNILPTMDDQPRLPYINAIHKECLRWQVVAPFAIAHTLPEDDEYNGYLIPKGTTIFPNIWAASRDPRVYPEPEEFGPDRWLPETGKEPPLDILKLVFGIGRRICPGRFMASNSFFLTIASVLATFDIEKAINEKGEPIVPNVDYTENFGRQAKPFKCDIKPRSKEIALLIRQTVEAEDAEKL
ncbi:cytochrome P450 [Pyrrhoderma noxium]|uniref:Cytochrome P450 n=1 Tax=Pyrrhoderma noxium TaxID=2282107 RepID=A0A286UCI6_9AGAM|nr:cytochrome P450 [Pyrrhoderma noxium]